MKLFEYKQKNIVVPFRSNLETELNKEGAEGWELVSIERPDKCIYGCLFKREVTEDIILLRKKKKSEFLDKPMHKLYYEGWFSTRAMNVLRYAGIETPRQLIKMKRADLLRHRNFGKWSLIQLDEMLDKHGFAFGQDLSEYEEVSHE